MICVEKMGEAASWPSPRQATLIWGFWGLGERFSALFPSSPFTQHLDRSVLAQLSSLPLDSKLLCFRKQEIPS